MSYPLVSVIIPVYQAENFVTECIRSVQAQNYPELEIILVDDGSTDCSGQMCEESAAADPRIRVLHQNNKGSGAARNAGIKEATGKYLLFLDADDKLDDSSAIRSLAARAEREQADIVIGTYRRWKANGEKVKCCSNLEKENPDSTEFRFQGFFQNGALSYDWGKLYRRSFLEVHDLWIPPYSYAEDKAHNFRCCACHPKYAFVPQSIVLYRENLQSLTFRPKKDLMQNWILLASDFEQFLKEKSLSRKYGDLIFFHLLIGAMYLAKEEMTYKGKKIRVVAKVLKKYHANPFVKEKLTWKACVHYTAHIQSLFWKALAFTLVFFLQVHAYSILAAVLVLMSRLGIDSL